MFTVKKITEQMITATIKIEGGTLSIGYEKGFAVIDEAGNIHTSPDYRNPQIKRYSVFKLKGAATQQADYLNHKAQAA